MACTWWHARCERQLLTHLMSSKGMTCLTSMTERTYCAAWQPLTYAKQESGSANPSEVTLEGDSCSKACALATGMFRGSAATWAWRCAGRAARNATAAAELPSAVPAEPLSAARGGEAKRSRASNRRCVAWLGFRKGEGAKARLLRWSTLAFCMGPQGGAAPRRSPRVSAGGPVGVPAFLTSLPTGSQWVRYARCRYTYWELHPAGPGAGGAEALAARSLRPARGRPGLASAPSPETADATCREARVARAAARRPRCRGRGEHGVHPPFDPILQKPHRAAAALLRTSTGLRYRSQRKGVRACTIGALLSAAFPLLRCIARSSYVSSVAFVLTSTPRTQVARHATPEGAQQSEAEEEAPARSANRRRDRPPHARRCRPATACA